MPRQSMVRYALRGAFLAGVLLPATVLAMWYWQRNNPVIVATQAALAASAEVAAGQPAHIAWYFDRLQDCRAKFDHYLVADDYWVAVKLAEYADAQTADMVADNESEAELVRASVGNLPPAINEAGQVWLTIWIPHTTAVGVYRVVLDITTYCNPIWSSHQVLEGPSLTVIDAAAAATAARPTTETAE